MPEIWNAKIPVWQDGYCILFISVSDNKRFGFSTLKTIWHERGVLLQFEQSKGLQVMLLSGADPPNIGCEMKQINQQNCCAEPHCSWLRGCGRGVRPPRVQFVWHFLSLFRKSSVRITTPWCRRITSTLRYLVNGALL